MSINLVLHSTDAISYAFGTAEFFVNWNNFYEDDPEAQYNISFSFITNTDDSIIPEDLYSLNIENLGTTFRTIEGTNTSGNSNNSLALGYVEPAKSESGADKLLKATFHTNPPVTIQGRPNNSLIKVSLRDFSKLKPQPDLTPAFMLFIRFQKL
jgi:hypothetical protein